MAIIAPSEKLAFLVMDLSQNGFKNSFCRFDNSNLCIGYSPIMMTSIFEVTNFNGSIRECDNSFRGFPYDYKLIICLRSTFSHTPLEY